MTEAADRGTVDATRQGGSNYFNKNTFASSSTLNIDEALAYVDSHVRWRAVLVRGDQALLTLADEILRMRNEA